jgi:hypothetical protein
LAGAAVFSITGSLSHETLELSQHLGGFFEQANYMIPNRLLQPIGLDARPRTFCFTTRCQRVRPRTAVVAPARPTALCREVTAVNTQPASAAFEQTTQEVVVFLVVPK